MTKLEISDDLNTKPEVPTPTGAPPAELVTDDVVVGEGAAAKPGDHVTVHYVGVSFDTGKQFDSSWDRHQPFDFPLGGGRVIQGWDFGVTGMREGGRRTLVIPPELAYGSRGVGPIGPDETLVFIVDLVKVGYAVRGRVIALLAVAALGLGACGDDEGGDAAPRAGDSRQRADRDDDHRLDLDDRQALQAGEHQGLQGHVEEADDHQALRRSADEARRRRTSWSARAPRRSPATTSRCTTSARCSTASSSRRRGTRASRLSARARRGRRHPGWDQGIVGMKGGGRRLLVIPPDLAYGDAGLGHIQPGETLIFVVDLVKRTAA